MQLASGKKHMLGLHGMRACSPCRPLPLAGDQRRQMSGALRMVPSPEHGTSHRMRSKRMASPWRKVSNHNDTHAACACTRTITTKAHLSVANQREKRGVVIGDEEGRAAAALAVMREQVAALRISVVGHHKPCKEGGE